jgi:putative ABC transport system ATP-binding protein
MLHISNLHYRYPGPNGAALTVPAFSLAASEHAIVLGPSGCGKSTLLHLLSAILKPQAGSVTVAGTDIGALTARAADRWRGRHIGFLPQKLALVSSLSARENLLFAAYANDTPDDAARADALLDALGLTDKATARPHQLSQGQQQRVAIGRALFNKPVLLLADEPTANLDDAACKGVTDLLIAQAAEAGASLVIATHDARVLAALPRATLLRLPITARSAD